MAVGKGSGVRGFARGVWKKKRSGGCSGRGIFFEKQMNFEKIVSRVLQTRLACIVCSGGGCFIFYRAISRPFIFYAKIKRFIKIINFGG